MNQDPELTMYLEYMLYPKQSEKISLPPVNTAFPTFYSMGAAIIELSRMLERYKNIPSSPVPTVPPIPSASSAFVTIKKKRRNFRR